MCRGMSGVSSTYMLCLGACWQRVLLIVMFRGILSVISAYMLCSVTFRLLFLLTCYVQSHFVCYFYLTVMFSGMSAVSYNLQLCSGTCRP